MSCEVDQQEKRHTLGNFGPLDRTQGNPWEITKQPCLYPRDVFITDLKHLIHFAKHN